jgi:signal transduction histidine kinase
LSVVDDAAANRAGTLPGKPRGWLTVMVLLAVIVCLGSWEILAWQPGVDAPGHLARGLATAAIASFVISHLMWRQRALPNGRGSTTHAGDGSESAFGSGRGPVGTPEPGGTADAHLRELSAAMAHEIRNPLAGIRGAVQVLRSDQNRPPVENAVMGEVLTQINRLEDVVSDLMTYAHPLPAHARPEILAQIVERAVEEIRRSPHMAGAGLTRDVDPDLAVLADCDLVTRALLIVLENAAHAVAGAGSIDIRAYRDGGTVVVSVHDSGPGIDEERRPDVFRAFYTTKHRGSGLGLAIARRIMDAQGGRIDFECPSAGGTTFLLALPATSLRSTGKRGLEPPRELSSGLADAQG